ncbi:hypothetical protein T492DRAFT_903088 [Pavlovales sp. CCMP2436]|nr:hypothetical protein T492DRAFT_903088 [Pavlovales sp. CCMP2436]
MRPRRDAPPEPKLHPVPYPPTLQMAPKRARAAPSAAADKNGGEAAPAELLRANLELRTQVAALAEMLGRMEEHAAHTGEAVARLERDSAAQAKQLGRIEEHAVRTGEAVARLERAGAGALHPTDGDLAELAGPDEAPLLAVGAGARAAGFAQLSAELLARVAAALEPDGELAASLSCRRLRAAVTGVRLLSRRALVTPDLAARAWLPMGLSHLRECCSWRPPTYAGVGARERLSMGLAHKLCICWGRPSGYSDLGARKRLPMG